MRILTSPQASRKYALLLLLILLIPLLIGISSFYIKLSGNLLLKHGTGAVTVWLLTAGAAVSLKPHAVMQRNRLLMMSRVNFNLTLRFVTGICVSVAGLTS